MEMFFGILLLFAMLGVCYVLGALITAIILHIIAMKSDFNEIKFFNMWINSIYYVTALVLVMNYFFPSYLSTFLYVTSIFSYYQQIDLLSDDENFDNFLETVFKS